MEEITKNDVQDTNDCHQEPEAALPPADAAWTMGKAVDDATAAMKRWMRVWGKIALLIVLLIALMVGLLSGNVNHEKEKRVEQIGESVTSRITHAAVQNNPLFDRLDGPSTCTTRVMEPTSSDEDEYLVYVKETYSGVYVSYVYKARVEPLKSEPSEVVLLSAGIFPDSTIKFYLDEGAFSDALKAYLADADHFKHWSSPYRELMTSADTVITLDNLVADLLPPEEVQGTYTVEGQGMSEKIEVTFIWDGEKLVIDDIGL